MIKLKPLSLLITASTAIFLSTAPAARASVASGTYTVDAGADVPLWDITGEYSQDDSDIGSIDLTITQEPNGDFTGNGTLDLSTILGSPVEIDGDVTVSGSVGGSGEKPSVSMKLDVLASDVTVESVYFESITVDVTGKFSINLPDDEMIGNATASAKAVYLNPKTNKYQTKGDSKPIKDGEIPLASDTTSDWSLTLDLTPGAKDKYTGTAEIVTSAGNELNFTVTGTYASKTDESTLTLKGKAGDLTLKTTTSGSTLTIDSISGKVSGQTLSYKN